MTTGQRGEKLSVRVPLLFNRFLVSSQSSPTSRSINLSPKYQLQRSLHSLNRVLLINCETFNSVKMQKSFGDELVIQITQESPEIEKIRRELHLEVDYVRSLHWWTTTKFASQSNFISYLPRDDQLSGLQKLVRLAIGCPINASLLIKLCDKLTKLQRKNERLKHLEVKQIVADLPSKLHRVSLPELEVLYVCFVSIKKDKNFRLRFDSPALNALRLGKLALPALKFRWAVLMR